MWPQFSPDLELQNNVLVGKLGLPVMNMCIASILLVAITLSCEEELDSHFKGVTNVSTKNVNFNYGYKEFTFIQRK